MVVFEFRSIPFPEIQIELYYNIPLAVAYLAFAGAVAEGAFSVGDGVCPAAETVPAVARFIARLAWVMMIRRSAAVPTVITASIAVR